MLAAENLLAIAAVLVFTPKLTLFVRPVSADFRNGPYGKTVAINSPTEWCMFLPPERGQNIGDHEYDAVAFCTTPKPPKNAPGARTFPKGFITASHYQRFEHYIQVTGRFNPDKYDLSRGDGGGQFDMKAPFRSICAGYKRYANLVEPNIGHFCIRCCKEDDKKLCNTYLSEYGCARVIGGNYGPESNTATVTMQEYLPTDFTPPATVILTRTVEATATSIKDPRPTTTPMEHPSEEQVPMIYPDVKSLTFVFETNTRQPIFIKGDDSCLDLNPHGTLDWSATSNVMAYASVFIPAGVSINAQFFVKEDCEGISVYELEVDTIATGRSSAFDLLPSFFGNFVGPQSVRVRVTEP